MLNTTSRLAARWARAFAEAYYAGGYTLFAALPLAQIVGRGVFTVIGLAYVLWGLGSLLMIRPHLDRRVCIATLLVLCAFAASIAVAADSALAIDRWTTFVLYSLVSLPVASAMQRGSDRRRLLDALAFSGAAALAFLYGNLLVRHGTPGFSPEHDMREDNLPLLTPFLLYWILRCDRWPQRAALAVLVVGAVTVYVVLSHGRAALVGLLAGLASFGMLVMRFRLRQVTAAILGLVLAIGLLQGRTLLRDADWDASWSTVLDRVSSHRTELWSKALDHPPANLWLGNGMGNVPTQVMIVEPSTPTQLRHFHNFLLDAWQETGLLGLGSLTGLLAFLLRRGFGNWNAQAVDPPTQRETGVLLSAAFAILVSALLSFSYGSKQFACYLIAFLSVAAKRGDSRPDTSVSRARR